jgi:hypothetical protein
MPATNSRNLTLTREGTNVRVRVTYNVVFSAFERALAGLGMQFIERISTLGVDPPGSTTGTVLAPAEFPAQLINVPPGAGPISVPRSREIVVTRAQLDEDSNILLPPDIDADEIRCRIRIQSIGLPPAITPDAFTDQEVLGLVVAPLPAAAAAASASD